METLHPCKIDLGLDRIRAISQRLGISKNTSKVITIAGTNGKGSCVRSLERLFVAQGKRVGSYTSPHILSYNERIQINEQCVSDAVLCDVFHQIDEARGESTVTYFEFATLAALLVFQQSRLDYWVLEVGLGGRLDAVNIIDPDIAVITSIDLDHEHWLGDTRELIAIEKLGILRQGITCVCAEDNPPSNMEDIFVQYHANTYLLGREFLLAEHDGDISISLKNSDNTEITYHLPVPQLPVKSVAAALQVLALLNTLPEASKLSQLVAKLRLSGRFERVDTPFATLVFDVAHNPAAGELLADKMAVYREFNVIALVGMLADKKISASLSPLQSVVNLWISCNLVSNPRAEKSSNIADILHRLGVDSASIRQRATVPQAIDLAFAEAKKRNSMDKNAANRKPVILIFGSFYTVAEAKAYLAENIPPNERINDG